MPAFRTGCRVACCCKLLLETMLAVVGGESTLLQHVAASSYGKVATHQFLKTSGTFAALQLDPRQQVAMLR